MTLPRAVPRSLPLSKHTNGQLAFRRSHHISSAIFIIFGHNTIIFYLSCAKGQLPLDRGAPRPTSDTLSCGVYHRLGPITLRLDHPGVKSGSWSSSSSAGQPEPTSDPGQIDLWPYKTTGCLVQWVDLSSRHGASGIIQGNNYLRKVIIYIIETVRYGVVDNGATRLCSIKLSCPNICGRLAAEVCVHMVAMFRVLYVSRGMFHAPCMVTDAVIHAGALYSGIFIPQTIIYRYIYIWST